MRDYVSTLKRHDIHHLVLIGGNGTMWSCLQIERYAQEAGYELAVLGVPKTVDNDLAGTDHAPGFASAARFISTMVRDSGADLSAMRNFETVRVLETMGRNVGWLALSSGYLKQEPSDPPHLIYVPEHNLFREGFLSAVEEAHRAYGYVVVVASEGLSPSSEDPLEHPVLGGISQDLARMVREELGLPSRGEPLGMGQRCYSLAVSQQDSQEAKELGVEAARAMRLGDSGHMLALERASSDKYGYSIRRVPFSRVANVERPLPGKWIGEPDLIPEEFREWLEPLIGEDLYAYPANLSEKSEF